MPDIEAIKAKIDYLGRAPHGHRSRILEWTFFAKAPGHSIWAVWYEVDERRFTSRGRRRDRIKSVRTPARFHAILMALLPPEEIAYAMAASISGRTPRRRPRKPKGDPKCPVSGTA